MEYKGYTAKVEFDDSADVFHGEVLHLKDVITFEGASVEQLWHEFKASVDDYLDFCRSRGEEPDKPFSGKFLVRVDPDLHRAAAIAAAKRNESLNAWVCTAIETALHPIRTPAANESLERTLQAAFRTVLEKQLTVSIKAQEPPQQHFIFPGHGGTSKHSDQVVGLWPIGFTSTIESGNDWIES